MHHPSEVTTFLFTDIEGSTRLWAQEPERMRPALARHDALTRTAVEGHDGTVVKMTGDGVYAAFPDPVDGISAALQLQLALADPTATDGVPLRVRCGLHAGVVERRDNDYFGSAVNRAARIMSAAHGGQVLLSQAVFALVADRLPAGVALHDLGAVRLRDLARPERIYQVVHPQLQQDFPTLRSLEATPNNLPQQIASFVGRERALVEVRQLLGKTRLLTLVGVGGLGKTRLSLQVGAEVLDDYADGVWFIELAPLSDALHVPQAVASVLGVKEEPGRSVQEALVKHVQGRQLLLILDNCEHLAQTCAGLAKELLQAGPQLKVLASSRESLHVVGETTYPLSTLAVPDPKKDLPIAALTQYEAVRLFSDRAVAAQPEFQVTRENAAAVADICHRLDGIPLALELAAARVRALSAATIAERLSDRFRLLTGGDATSLPRQQTLRACIDWSYDLLAAPERALLRRLAVFAGGWTLQAAEAVGTGREVDKPDVLDLLTQLVAKSLVEFDVEGERYRLLETVRQYAQERMNESGAEDESRMRHLVYYLALAEEAELKLQTLEQGAWLSRLDLERENLLSAHRWCDRAEGAAELGPRLLGALGAYWIIRGLLELGRRVTVEALTRAGTQNRSLAKSRVLSTACNLSFYMGRYGDAQRYGEESLAIAREIGDHGRVAGALGILGEVSHSQGNRAMARQYLEEAVAMSQGPAEKYRRSYLLNGLAELHRAEGDLDTAERLYEESLTLSRERGDHVNTAVTLLNAAMVSISRGSRESARGRLVEALETRGILQSKYVGQAVISISAALALSLADVERAARFYGAAEAQREQIGYHRLPADEALLAPVIAGARAALGREAFATSEAAGRALSYEEAMAEARAWLENRS